MSVVEGVSSLDVLGQAPRAHLGDLKWILAALTGGRRILAAQLAERSGFARTGFVFPVYKGMSVQAWSQSNPDPDRTSCQARLWRTRE